MFKTMEFDAAKSKAVRIARIAILLSSGFCGLGSSAYAQGWQAVLDGTAFNNNTSLWASFNNAYPWGTDHNGSARMYAANVTTDGAGTLIVNAAPCSPEGNSNQPPNLAIHYHSGTVYWKQQITVNSTNPQWYISGDFIVPSAYGTWPAFWLTGVNTWSPEIDQMEFKGNSTVWQNTFVGIYPNVSNTSHTTAISNPGSYHNYAVWIHQSNSTDALVDYYIDSKWIARDTATNYVGAPMWMILDLQMEGSSGSPGPTSTQYYYAKNVKVLRLGQSATNYLSNPGFESGALSPWTVWSPNGTGSAGYVESTSGHASNSGNYHAGEWSSHAYNVDISQTPTGLPNGTYTLSAWVSTTGGQSTCWMYAKNYGGSEIDYPLNTINNWNRNYTFVSIPNINVTNGKCECGFYTIDTTGNHALVFDDVTLTKN